MLANYHRWIFEKQKRKSVETLRKWVIQEAEFQTQALEAAHGLSQPRLGNLRLRNLRSKLLIHTLGSLMPSQMWEYSDHTHREPVECVTNLMEHGLVRSLSRWMYRAGGNVLNEITKDNFANAQGCVGLTIVRRCTNGYYTVIPVSHLQSQVTKHLRLYLWS